jgi:ATPase subunit of ABC transporter with duplicated ATPase domains
VDREAKVRPHLDAQKAINAEFKPLVDGAKADADTIRGALSKYLAAEEAKARAEAERKAREENERRMAEHRRQQEEAARAHAEAMAKAAAEKAAEPPPPPPVVESPVFVSPEPVKMQAGGQRGKKASLRTITRYEVTDYAVALAHVQHHPDVQAAVEKVAFAQARAGAQVPGVRSFEEKVAV